MKTPLLILVLFSFFQFIGSIYAQETQKVQYIDHSGNVTTEFFYSIFENDTLNNGPYIEYYSNGKVKDSCYFERGIRIGTEIFYDI
jgi:antitoxin component YwqK of YwqJK toxin-antitoxin module